MRCKIDVIVCFSQITTIAGLHRLYKEQRASLNKVAASYDTYARIFNTEFNHSFFCPKKDQFDLCESYKNSDEEGRKKLELNFQDHLKQKELSRGEKSNDIAMCTEPGSNLHSSCDLWCTSSNACTTRRIIGIVLRIKAQLLQFHCKLIVVILLNKILKKLLFCVLHNIAFHN